MPTPGERGDARLQRPRARHLDPADYPLAGGSDGDWFQWPAVTEDRNIIGYSSICVPGTIDGLRTALAERGTLSFAEALAPAIAIAERGLEIDWFSELCLAIDAANWPASRSPPNSSSTMDGAPKSPARAANDTGRCSARPRRCAAAPRAGPRDFYEGAIARRLVEDLQARRLGFRRMIWPATNALGRRRPGSTIGARRSTPWAGPFRRSEPASALSELATSLRAGSAPPARRPWPMPRRSGRPTASADDHGPRRAKRGLHDPYQRRRP